MTLYIVVPPEKMRSHACLLRLWIATLLITVIRRPSIPATRTLFLLDECAQLGELDALRTAITLTRSSGLNVWTFWQDMSQLAHLYPRDWRTMVNNCSLFVWGAANYVAAMDVAKLVGDAPGAIMDLDPEHAILQEIGRPPRRLRRLNYLRDALFNKLHDPNPRYAKHPAKPLPRSFGRG